MIETRAARRYGKALFELAVAAGTVAQVASDLDHLQGLVRQFPDLLAVLAHPRIARGRKEKLLSEVVAPVISRNTLAFLSLLVEKRRVALFSSAADHYRHLIRQWQNRLLAQVTSAVPLSHDERQALVQKLSSVTGKETEISERVDPSILGGLQIRFGDHLMDGSVTAYLTALKERLKRAKVIELEVKEKWQ